MSQIKIVVPLVALIIGQHFYFENQLAELEKLTIEKLTIEKLRSISNSSQLTPNKVIHLPEFSKLAQRAKPSVVSIEVFDQDTLNSVTGMGSGFVISSDGYILTNHHVTQDANRIVVKLADGSEHDAIHIGRDARTDIALLKIKQDNLTAFEFGNVEQTHVGSWVVAIGAPFGYEQTVTAGIISAKGRNVGEQYIPYIQTDVAINVGNSGGPLINMDGKVVGINSKIISTDGGSLGLSFAIPIDLAIDVVNQLKSSGVVRRGYLGVGYTKVTREIAEKLSIKENKGALINAVSQGSPAEKGGLKVGDVVMAVDGKKIVNFSELPFLVGRLRPGVQTELSVIRDGKESKVILKVGSRNLQES
jgi:serine protease Do